MTFIAEWFSNILNILYWQTSTWYSAGHHKVPKVVFYVCGVISLVNMKFGQVVYKHCGFTNGS